MPTTPTTLLRRTRPVAVVAGLTVCALGAQLAAGPGHVVTPGQTLSGIASAHGVSVEELAAANGIDDVDLIIAGRELTVPEGNGSGAGSSEPSESGAPEALAASPSRRELAPRFDHWAANYGVPADLLSALTWMESGWQNDVVSSAGAQGIGQLMPDTVDFVNDLLGADLDPAVADDNIRMSARFLAYLLDANDGDVRASLASYYQGLRSVRERGIYSGTDDYIDNVLALRARF